MTGRMIAAIAGVVLLALAGVVLVRGTGDDTRSRPDASDERSARKPPDWPVHSSRELRFTFRYPPEATVDRIDPGVKGEPPRVRVRLIGPESGEATEITDGFTLYVRLARAGTSTSLRELARRVLEQQSGRGGDTLAWAEVVGRGGYRFITRSELGDEVRHLVLPAGDEAAFVVTCVISGPAGRGYERQVRRIIRSLEPMSGVQGVPGTSSPTS